MSEARCDHPFAASYPDGMHHCRDCGATWDEPDAPAPPPTREPIRLTAEAEAAASEAWSRMGVEFVKGTRDRANLPDWGQFAPAFVAGFRAARLAGGPTLADAEQRGREDNADHGMCYVHGSKALAGKLADAWEEGLGVGTGMARIYGHTDNWPDVEPANPYRTPESEDTE